MALHVDDDNLFNFFCREEYRRSLNLPGLAPAQKDYFTANYEDSDRSDFEEEDASYEESHAM